jgi:hypothetical protein
VANWAAQIRSPSFSRFSSSTTTTISPLRMAARPSAMVSNWKSGLLRGTGHQADALALL